MKKIKVTQFASGLDHPEGLAFDREGYLWAGGEAGQIYRISPDGNTVECVANTDGFHLGLAFSPEGWLAVCDGQKNCIWKFNPADRSVTPWAVESGGRSLGGMNFPVFDSAGNLYASENGRWGAPEGVVHRFRPDGSGEPWADRFYFANGLALKAEEDSLFVVQSSEDDVVRVSVRPDGSAGAREVFAAGVIHVPDGLAFDAEGHLYVCCYGDNAIWKVNARGDKELLASDPTSRQLNRATNLAFGGPQGTTLYVANLGGYHIATIELNVNGQPLAGRKHL